MLRENESYIKELAQEKYNEFHECVENLKEHVERGCLSGIDRGHGTESNELLHRILNYNCLAGITVISPELALP